MAGVILVAASFAGDRTEQAANVAQAIRRRTRLPCRLLSNHLHHAAVDGGQGSNENEKDGERENELHRDVGNERKTFKKREAILEKASGADNRNCEKRDESEF